MPDHAASDPPTHLPRHIAIVMDGNGRWAEQRKRPRSFGHREGQKALRACVEFCLRQGVPALTLFAFSSENWKRHWIARSTSCTVTTSASTSLATSAHFHLTCAHACWQRWRKPPAISPCTPASRSITVVAGILPKPPERQPRLCCAVNWQSMTSTKPVSNFLLWQIAYAELYFTEKLWPDVDAVVLTEALHEYARRERRYGRVSAQALTTD